jgi:hypothetical protein
VITMNFKAAKEGFFDKKKVLDALDKATLRIFKEFGRRVRARAQKSLRYGEKPSAPGSPPTAHKSNTIERTSKSTGKKRVRSVSFLREYLWFAFDTSTKSVVIGPARLNGTVSADAPRALEDGGTSTILDHGKRLKVSIKARPFMGPAAQAERAGLPAMWQDSVR